MFWKLFYIFLSVILGVMGQLFLKQGMLKIGEFPNQFSLIVNYYIKVALNHYIWLGFASYGLSFIIWLGILSKVELSYARPLAASGYVFVALFSWWLWGENLSAQRWIGIILITIGVILVSKS